MTKADDKFWVVVFATAPAVMYLSTSKNAPPKKHAVREGLTKLSHPLVAGESMRAVMMRQDTVVAECAPRGGQFKVEEHPETYDFNAYVAMSP